MNALGTLTVVTAAAGSCGAALVGWLLAARAERRGRPQPRPSQRWRSAVTAFLVVAAVVAAVAAPIVSVLWMVVALNFLLGQRENMPFSTYPMFSTPSAHAWTLRFEDSNGTPIAIGKIGLAPHIVRKRFETELRAARQRGIATSAPHDATLPQWSPRCSSSTGPLEARWPRLPSRSS